MVGNLGGNEGTGSCGRLEGSLERHDCRVVAMALQTLSLKRFAIVVCFHKRCRGLYRHSYLSFYFPTTYSRIFTIFLILSHISRFQ